MVSRRFSFIPGRIPELRDPQALMPFLNELARLLNANNDFLFNTDNGWVFETARKRPFVDISTNYQMGPTDSVVLADANSGSLTITLPDPLDASRTFFDVKRTDVNGANTVTVSGTGSELPYVLSGTSRPSLTLYCDGTDYWII